MRTYNECVPLMKLECVKLYIEYVAQLKKSKDTFVGLLALLFRLN